MTCTEGRRSRRHCECRMSMAIMVRAHVDLGQAITSNMAIQDGKQLVAVRCSSKKFRPSTAILDLLIISC